MTIPLRSSRMRSRCCSSTAPSTRGVSCSLEVVRAGSFPDDNARRWSIQTADAFLGHRGADSHSDNRPLRRQRSYRDSRRSAPNQAGLTRSSSGDAANTSRTKPHTPLREWSCPASEENPSCGTVPGCHSRHRLGRLRRHSRREGGANGRRRGIAIRWGQAVRVGQGNRTRDRQSGGSQAVFQRLKPVLPSSN